MNEELQKQLAEMLAKLMTFAEDGAKWAGEQIPPLVREKIALGRAEESVWMAVSVGLLLAGVVIAVKTWPWMVDNLDYGPTPLVTAVAVLPGIIAVSGNLHGFLLVWFAPRLYIVEWLRTLIQ